MWCDKCQADVAAEASADNQRLHCATCGTEINLRSGTTAPADQPATGATPRPKSKDPHELLARWANEDLFDPTRMRTKSGVSAESSSVTEPPTKPQPSDGLVVTDSQRSGERQPRESVTTADPPGPASRKATTPGGPAGSDSLRAPHYESSPTARRTNSITEPEPTAPAVLRFDGHHITSQPGPNFIRIDGVTMPPGRFAPPPQQPPTPVPQPQPEPHAYILHSAESGLPAPHIPVRIPGPPAKEKSSNWVTFAGQMFAYLGVGTLTIGTVFVLMGYFGGPANYAPTGWLITTAGQMMLFLGVVTLISGGMEETTQEVARRIDTLGDKLIRIEQASHSPPLHGPHTPPTAGQSSPDHELRDLVVRLNQHLERLNRS
ncbi:MAG: hypothetical protein HZA46_11615 [Planctomycetales bacterium]|nr:hypothetical protein [Planctomycetales bacterium]